MMLVVVSYDVRTEDAAGRRRLRRVSKLCQDHGQRVQFSVFECLLDPAQWTALRAALMTAPYRLWQSLRSPGSGTPTLYRTDRSTAGVGIERQRFFSALRNSRDPLMQRTAMSDMHKLGYGW